MAEHKEILDNLEAIAGIDRSGMLSLIDGLPAMMEEAWASAERFDMAKAGKINNLVVAGMGGSAISGDIISVILKGKVDFPIVVNRSYSCPKYVGSGTLMLAVSYSGNTEETISTFKEAVTRGARIISITSGGDLKELSMKNKVPVVEVPKGLPPRAALGHLLASILNVLYKTGVDKEIKNEVEETIKSLKQLSKKYGIKCETRDNEAKQMAQRLAGKVPVIMASESATYAAGLRWKTQINENSKTTALLSIFPELNHNDMVNFANLKSRQHDFSFVLLRDEDDPERMKKRIEITKSLISGHVGGITEVWSQGKSMLERMMSLVILGDYLSVYLAVLSGTDPTPVEIIEKLKKELQR